jgi:O-antigen ligase
MGASGLRRRVSVPVARLIWLAGCLVAAAGLAAVASSSRAARMLLSARISLDSSERSGTAGAAVRLIAHHPWLGTGPGRSRYIWTAPTGQVEIARYAHDEYLQLLVELGAIGLVLLLCVLVAAIVAVRAGRPPVSAGPISPGPISPDPISAGPTGAGLVRAGAIAALIALAVHSGFDFLWQLAVVPLAVGILIGLAGPAALGSAVKGPAAKGPAVATPQGEPAHPVDLREEQ